MFAEVLDPQHEFMFPIVLPNLSKKFYCSRQSLLGLLGRASFRTYHKPSLCNTWKHISNGWWNWGRSQNSDSVSARSLLWDQQVFCVKKLTSEKVTGSLTIAWCKCSRLHLDVFVSEVSRRFRFRSRRGWPPRCAFVRTDCTRMHQRGHKLLWGVKWYFF